MFEQEKKRNHDLAYLIAILIVLAVTFLFANVFVKILLNGIPIPHP